MAEAVVRALDPSYPTYLEESVSATASCCVVCGRTGGETYMGIFSLESIERECECRTSSRSRELSLSLEDIVYNGSGGDIQCRAKLWRNELLYGGQIEFVPIASRNRELGDAAILRGYIIVRDIVCVKV